MPRTADRGSKPQPATEEFQAILKISARRRYVIILSCFQQRQRLSRNYPPSHAVCSEHCRRSFGSASLVPAAGQRRRAPFPGAAGRAPGCGVAARGKRRMRVHRASAPCVMIGRRNGVGKTGRKIGGADPACRNGRHDGLDIRASAPPPCRTRRKGLVIFLLSARRACAQSGAKSTPRNMRALPRLAALHLPSREQEDVPARRRGVSPPFCRDRASRPARENGRAGAFKLPPAPFDRRSGPAIRAEGIVCWRSKPWRSTRFCR